MDSTSLCALAVYRGTISRLMDLYGANNKINFGALSHVEKTRVDFLNIVH